MRNDNGQTQTNLRGVNSVASGLNARDWKIVEAIYLLSKDGPRVVTYEDIVVKAWELYPAEFGLRGYADRFPDASDIHKRLYNALKSKGWISTAGQKQFSLTMTGWERAGQLLGLKDRGDSTQGGRARRETKLEIEHLQSSDAVRLYMEGKVDDVLDTDFFAFYRTSVRAKPQDFEKRLSEVDTALSDAERYALPGATELREVDSNLRRKFAPMIASITERKKRE